jgi:hypothetical protein
VFLDFATQKYYVLAAGRWFSGTAIGSALKMSDPSIVSVPMGFGCALQMATTRS